MELLVQPLITGIMTVAVAIFASVMGARRDQRHSLDLRFEKFVKTLSTMQDHVESKIEGLRNEFGEALHAFRERDNEIERKHQRLELYVRDHYVAKDDFKSAILELKDAMLRIEQKLDRT